MRILRTALCGAALLWTSPAVAERILQNDNVGESINSPVASAEIISGEAYEAVFDIPAEYMPENSGRPLNITGVRVLMVDKPGGGRACGRFSVEIYEEPAGMSVVEPTCEVIDQNNLQLCILDPCSAPLICNALSICVANPRHKDPGTKLFDLASIPVAMGPLGFVIEGSPHQGNATFTDLTIAAINQNMGVNIQPIPVTTNRVRVALRAIDEQCGTIGQGTYFPIMASDTNGVSGDSRNFLYGREPNFCPTFRHYVWEDFASGFQNSTPGDWLIRLIVDYDDNTTIPDMGTPDMGDDMDMGIVDMDVPDMEDDTGIDPMDMAADTGNNTTNNEPGNNTTNNGTGGLLVASITPNTGENTASTPVLIVGEGFQAGIEVLVGTTAIGVTETRPERIRATVPEGLTPGVYDVILTNPDDSTVVLAQAFTVTDPSTNRQSGAEEGCGCAATGAQIPGAALLLLVVGGFLRLRRRYIA